LGTKAASGFFERLVMMLISMMSLTVAQSMGGDGVGMTMWTDDVGSTIG